MTIQFNTGNHVTQSEEHRESLKVYISKEFETYNHHITRLEVHLSDENGIKSGINDKRCMLEARVEGLQPIAVTSNANTYEQALDGAIDKMKASLKTILGRAKRF